MGGGGGGAPTERDMMTRPDENAPVQLLFVTHPNTKKKKKKKKKEKKSLKIAVLNREIMDCHR